MGGGQSAPRPQIIPASKTGITLYYACDKQGWAKVLNEGEYDITKNPGLFPKDASYIVVPKGFTATIYTGSYSGQEKTFVGPTEWSFCSGNWWANDKIRSIRVINTNVPSTSVTLYQDCDKKGWTKILNIGEYDITNTKGSKGLLRGAFPPDASYIVVPKGLTATIYTGSYSGHEKTFVGPTEWSFCNESRWANDKIHSIRIKNTGATPSDTTAKPPIIPNQVSCPPPPPPEVDSRIFNILSVNNLFNTNPPNAVPMKCKDIQKAARVTGSLDNFLNIYKLNTEQSIKHLSDFVGALGSPSVDQMLRADTVTGYSQLATYLTQMETSQIPVIRNVGNCLHEANTESPKLLEKAKENYETSKERYETIMNEDDQRVSYYEGWFPITRPLTVTTLYVLFAMGLFFIIISILLFLGMKGVELRFILPVTAATMNGYGYYGPYVVSGIIIGGVGVGLYIWARQFYEI